MVDLSADATVPTVLKSRRRSIFGRIGDWLFSQRHFHFKLLSGTTVGVAVIIFLAGVFLLVTLRNHYQDALRTHTIEVIRLSSLIENDIAALESGHRGYLLSGNELYIAPFDRKRELLKGRVEGLTALILDSPKQRKRVMKVQEVVQKWLDTVALPEINARRAKGATGAAPEAGAVGSVSLGNSLLDQAREVLQSLQDEEQIVLNQRMQEQEWATQSTQILDFIPKLERSILEMQKEKRGYLLTGEAKCVEADKRAVTDFYTYNGYLSILVANAPGQAQLLAEVRSKLERWINGSAVPEMDAKSAGQDVTVLASSDNGEALIADIRQTLTNLEKNELGVYQTRTAAASRERVNETSALGGLAFLAVVLLVVSNSYSIVLVRWQLAKLEGIEARIRSIIQNILDGMITVDEQGVICSTNPAAEKMFGYSEKDMHGQKFTKLVPKSFGSEPDAKPVICSWQEIA